MDRGTIVSIDIGKEIVDCESSNKKKRSSAWDHFEKIPTENKTEGKAKCLHCNSLFSSTPRSGTSHLKRHMERCAKRTAISVEPIAVDFGCTDFEANTHSCKLGKRVSKVWQEYELFPAPNMNDAKAKCKHCNLVLSAASKNGTSHLKRHLDKCTKRVVLPGEQYFHSSELFADDSNLDEVPKILTASSNMNRSPMVGETLVGGSNSTLSEQVYQDELQRCISVCIIKGVHPFSFVEENGFRSMMSKACPQFNPFSRGVVRKELFSMYLKERDNIKELLAKAPGRICLTVGNWKARDTKEEYICVTTHFINDQWKLLRRVLCFKALAPPYDGTYIADELACLSSQYNIESKTFTITVDEASYNESMVSSIKRGLLTKKALVSGGSFSSQVNCSANILNVLAQSSLKLVDDSVERIRELVKYVNKSPLQRKKFFDVAEKTFELKSRKRISLDMLHKWSSTYKLIDRSIYYRCVFKHLVESKQELSYLSLSKEEWQRLSIVHKFLKVLHEVTRLFSSANSPSANLFLKGMLMVHCRMIEIVNGPDSFMANAVKAMQVKFDEIRSKNNLILSCAAILDPRYKVKFVEYCYMKLHGPDKVEECVSKVVSTLYCLYAEYKQAARFSSLYAGSSSVSTNFGGGNEEGDMFGDYNQFLSSTSKSQGNKPELDLYLEEPSYDLNSDLDVLEFWSGSSMRYPELAVMARDILCIPVCTVNTKEAFSLGSKTLSSVQSSVMPETLQALLCLKDWLHADHNSGDQNYTGDEPGGSSDDDEYDNEDDDSVLTDSI